jgi:hypothetical protein
VSDGGRQRLVRRAAVAAGALIVACLAGLVVSVTLRPRQFDTFRDAIGYELGRRGIAYREIYVVHSWPDTVNTERYAANVEVVMEDERRVPGMVACRSGRKTCSFSLASLGIERAPLPDLVQRSEQPWLTWIERELGRFGLSLPAGVAP